MEIIAELLQFKKVGRVGNADLLSGPCVSSFWLFHGQRAPFLLHGFTLLNCFPPLSHWPSLCFLLSLHLLSLFQLLGDFRVSWGFIPKYPRSSGL